LPHNNGGKTAKGAKITKMNKKVFAPFLQRFTTRDESRSSERIANKMKRRSDSQPGPAGRGLYQIWIGQHLDPECSDWLGGLEITNLEGGEAILSGSLEDQAALYGVLQYLRDLHVTLIEIRRVDREGSSRQSDDRNDERWTMNSENNNV
jgi:hypothetical protein